jgi:hypothetical protein
VIINLALECACAARSSVGCILYDIIIFEIFEFQNNIVVVPGTVALRDLLARYRDSNLQRKNRLSKSHHGIVVTIQSAENFSPL